MFLIKSFDLKVMYLVVFVGFFMTLFLKAQYIGYALMLLSLLGIFVIDPNKQTARSDVDANPTWSAMFCSWSGGGSRESIF